MRAAHGFDADTALDAARSSAPCCAPLPCHHPRERDWASTQSQWPGDQHVVISGGLNNAFRYNPIKFAGFQPTEDIVVALRGHWQDDHTFVEEYIRDLNSEINLITQKSTFEGQRITVELTSSMQPFTLQAVGEMIP